MNLEQMYSGNETMVNPSVYGFGGDSKFATSLAKSFQEIEMQIPQEFARKSLVSAISDILKEGSRFNVEDASQSFVPATAVSKNPGKAPAGRGV